MLVQDTSRIKIGQAALNITDRGKAARDSAPRSHQRDFRDYTTCKIIYLLSAFKQ
jgi:hypothetical protein